METKLHKKIQELEQAREEDRRAFEKKIELYKDQVRKMRENIELFKESIS